MAVRKLVFLSDVHVGANTPVNWYQKDVHEPYLQAALGHIFKSAAEISELIVLGDLVDLWTYLPRQPPAGFTDVLAANPQLFAYNGPPGYGLLGQVLTALDGRVTYMNGNHDMTVTQADLDLIAGAQGQTMRRVDSQTYTPKGGLGQVACTHGHIFSVFCAPDKQGLLGTLPIGYFVTRLAAQWDAQQLKENYPPGATVADMPDTGTPTGWGFSEKDLKRFLECIAGPRCNLAKLVFDIIIGGNPEKHKEQIFVMPDGSRPNAYELARGPYDSTYDEWVKQAESQPDLFGHEPGPFALKDVDYDDSLVHFADGLGIHHKVVVMGHTHAPKDKKEESGWIIDRGTYLYINCGFNCPSKPDMANPANPKHPTFVELEIDDAAKVCVAKVRYVQKLNGTYAVAPKPLEQAKIAL